MIVLRFEAKIRTHKIYGPVALFVQLGEVSLNDTFNATTYTYAIMNRGQS